MDIHVDEVRNIAMVSEPEYTFLFLFCHSCYRISISKHPA